MDLSFLTSRPIAHRGLHDAERPENSLPAFENAIAHGYPVEMDVRLSKDGEIFVFHDHILNRMLGIDKQFIDCTKEELSTYLLDGKEHIPTLAEFLKFIDGRTPILLEIKNVPETDGKQFVKRIAEALDGYQGLYAVQSFVPFYVGYYKKLRPDIPCGILASAQSSKYDFNCSPIWRIKAYAVKNMSFNRKIKPDFISYHFSDYPNRATRKFKGLKLGWTIHSADDEAYARKYADNIIFEGYEPAEK